MLEIKKVYLLLIVALVASSVCGDCIMEPWKPECKNEKIPDSKLNEMNDALCSAMYMPGCTIKHYCSEEEYKDMYPQYCSPFAIYKTLCSDMPGMSNCSDYKNMCMNNKSVVEQCNTKIVTLPSSHKLADDIVGICKMGMAGCEKCNSHGMKCDGLQVYSDMCIAMSMPECSDWTTMCEEVGKWPLCQNKAIPSMVMYFHFGITEYLLFQGWVPQEEWQYVLSLIIVFVSSILYELLKLARYKMEKKLVPEKRALMHTQHHDDRPSWNFKSSAIRSIFHLIEVTFGSLLMLLLMTYNVGLVVVIILGRAIGAFIVGDRMDYKSQTSATAECH